MSYFPSISQNVTVDTANSVSAQTIAAGATWNTGGTGTSTLGVAGIQVVVKAVQNLTIYIEQGSTSSTFVITDQYNYNAIKGNFGITVQAVAAFVRVRVKNISLTDDTDVNVFTCLCPIVEAIPRALDENGYFKTAIYELNDEYGNKGIFSPVGALDVNQPYRLIGNSFKTSIDTTFWNATNNGTSSLAVVGSGSGGTNGMASLASGTVNSGYGMFRTVRFARFLIGNPNKCRLLVRVPALTKAGCTRNWGAFTTSGSGATPPSPVDGFFFSLSPADILSVNCYNGGSASYTSVPSGSFNGSVSQFVMDTNVHVYNITYYLGKIQFFIDEILIHTFTATTVLPASTFTLPVTCNTVNSGAGTTSGTLELWTGSIHRLGREISAPIWKNQVGAVTAAIAKSSAGVLRSLSINSETNGTVTLYDALSATNPIMAMTTNGVAPVTLNYNLDFYTGLTYTTSAAGHNITLVFE